MTRVILFYLFIIVVFISCIFLLYGFKKKIYIIKIISSYLLGISIMITGFMIPNGYVQWLTSILGLIFLIAPNNIKEIDFTKIGH